MKTYYNDTLKKVTFENKELNLDEIEKQFQELSAHKGAYIAFIDSYDEVIIFNWRKINKWLVEYIIAPGELHGQKYVTNDECIPLIKRIYNEENVTSKGFEDVPIGEFTLDQILIFKQEDERLLREEEIGPKKIVVSAKQSNIATKPKKKRKSTMVLGGALGADKKKVTPVVPPKPKKVSTKREKIVFEREEEVVAKKTTAPDQKKALAKKPKKAQESMLLCGQLGAKENKATKPETKAKENPKDDNSFFSI